ncbi:serine carboxypeptidase S28 family protein [Actinidia rufa]|uniref:Serine carboxypeptidase S28 family protein n=1 Tax=Actinidia rufa TaxID=165716 RepID=A0A7J0EKD5_9ERIC|nr:serine carboxypeptidase S28 family protein [Actinidia rufa]
MATPSLATPLALSLLHLLLLFLCHSSASPNPDSPIAPLASPPDLLSEHPNYSHNNSNNSSTGTRPGTLSSSSTTSASPICRRSGSGTSSTPSIGRAPPVWAPSSSTAATREKSCGSPPTLASSGRSRLDSAPWSSSPRGKKIAAKNPTEGSVWHPHRYYGESMPYGSIDEAYKNATTLAHLTAEQALADFAILITDLKKNLSAEACPVVLFGGSYGGMLAAWMRLKYPHIAIGALASSAPVLQFEDIVPPETFYDIVSNSFRRESTSCFNTIRESWDILESEGQKNDGLLQLTKTFRLLSPDLIKINDRKLGSIDDLYNWLESAYSYLAMVNYPYPANFMMPLPGDPIKEVCRKIDNCPNGTSILDRLFAGVSVYYNYTGEFDCFQLDDDPHGLDGWNWQACTEMVMPNVYKTGYVLDDVSDTIVALVTEKGAHHLDLRAVTAEDPDWLLEQRKSEIKLIRGWLHDYYDKKQAFFAM